MPQRINKTSDIGTSMKFSGVYDTDHIYLSDEGWVYRHYKSQDLSRWWDEILVAGEVEATDVNGDANAPVQATNPPDLGDKASTPTFEVGYGKKDFEYSPTEKSDGSGVVAKVVVADTSDNVPFPPAAPPVDPTPPDSPADDPDSSDDADDSGDGSAAAPMG